MSSPAALQPNSPHAWCYNAFVNHALLSLVPRECRKVLDVGCGTGANAKAFRDRGGSVWGITCSEEEAKLASAFCDKVYLADLDIAVPSDLPDDLDLLFMSHVLEHLRRPAETLTKLCTRLRAGGYAAIAVPNMAYWPLRERLLKGDWHRTDEGAFDRTHLQFWSFETAPQVLQRTGLQLIAHTCEAVQTPFPLRSLLPNSVTELIDRIQATRFANTFGWQTLLLAQKM